MKKHFEDKIRDLIKAHEKQTGQEITEVKVNTNPRIGFKGERQIIVNYWTK